MRATRSVGAIKSTTALVLIAMSSVAFAQTAVLGSNTAGHTFVYPNVTWPAGACPANLPSNTVSGSAGAPHGVGFYGADFALVSSFSTSQIFNVQLSTASTLNTINSGAFGYTGTGTIAVAPSLNFALAQENAALKVLQAPFTAPTTTSLAMPGSVASYQTQASYSIRRRAHSYPAPPASRSWILRIRRSPSPWPSAPPRPLPSLPTATR